MNSGTKLKAQSTKKSSKFKTQKSSSVKNPHTVDDAHRDPAELLAEYQKAQTAVAEVREKSRKELEIALTR